MTEEGDEMELKQDTDWPAPCATRRSSSSRRRPPAVDLRCGGQAMSPRARRPPAPSSTDDGDGHADRQALRRRVDIGLEILCTKAGTGSLSIGDGGPGRRRAPSRCRRRTDRAPPHMAHLGVCMHLYLLEMAADALGDRVAVGSRGRRASPTASCSSRPARRPHWACRPAASSGSGSSTSTPTPCRAAVRHRARRDARSSR